MAHAATTPRDLVPTPAVGAHDAAKPSSEPGWRPLLRVAGVGAILTGILIPLQVVAFIVWPLPEGGVLEWFDLFQESPIIALISFDLVLLVEEVLLIPIVLALYVLLRRSSPSLMILAAGAWLISVALFIGSNTAFDMLALSNGYADAGSAAERAAFVAAGQAALTAYMQNGTAFVFGYLLASLAGILVGVAMLRSHVFPRLAGWAAIAANVLGAGLFLPVIGVPLAIGSVLILVAWYLLIGWRMVRMELVTEAVTEEWRH